MEFDTYEFKIPTWAVCPLEYGDYSGLTDEDISDLESFIESLPRDSNGCIGHFIWPDESYFSHDNDISSLGSDVYDAEYLVESCDCNDPMLNPDQTLPLI